MNCQALLIYMFHIYSFVSVLIVYNEERKTLIIYFQAEISNIKVGFWTNY